MTKNEILLMKLECDRDYSKRQVVQSIETLRRILDNIEKKIDSVDLNADEGFQGNEWRLYKELSNLERYNKFIEEIKNMKGGE